MANKVALIAMLVVPFFVRELVDWVTSRGQPRGARVGGEVSVWIWIPSHLILLALATRAALIAPIGLRGWLGYSIYIAAIVLRIASFQALKAFYSPDVVIREG